MTKHKYSGKYRIIQIVSEMDLINFQSNVNALKAVCEEKGMYISKEIYSTTVVPMQSAQGTAMVSIPSCFLEAYCSEEDYKTWKFQTKLKLS